jgi:signal peptidase II
LAISISRTSLLTYIKAIRPMLIAAAIVIFLDQVTKEIVRRTVAINGKIEIIRGYFEISYAENTGAAFGMFQGQNRIFIIVGLAAIGFIILYYRQFRENIWMRISLGLLMGGALGNLIDRVVFHYVTDFIRVRWWLMHLRWWPAFNIADASVFVGAAMLIVGMIKRSKSMDQQINGAMSP